MDYAGAMRDGTLRQGGRLAGRSGVWVARSAGAAAALGIWALVAGCPGDPGAGSGGGDAAAVGGGDGGSGGGADLRPSAPAPQCSPDGWCWRNPLPQGNPLNTVYAAAPDRIWAAGDRGLILYYDGAS